jgi:hypothetical protein
MGTADTISIIKDILLGLSAIAVAVFAWIGLKTWRKELTGKARFEVARNIMHLALELQAYFNDARNLFTRSIEWADRIKQEGERKNVSQVLDEWYARGNRLRPIAESLNKITEAQWESEILLNESSAQSIKEAVQSYRENYAELASSVSSYFDTRKDEAHTGVPYKDQEWLKELHMTIYAVKEDNFSKKINEATDKLSSTLKQYVK